MVCGQNDLSEYLTTNFPWYRHEFSHQEYLNNLTWWEYVNTLFEYALISNGINKVIASELAKQVRNEYLDIDQWSLFEDTKRNLDKSISEGHTNYILSNHTPELSDLVNGLNIQDYFVKVITSAHVGYEKPNKKSLIY